MKSTKVVLCVLLGLLLRRPTLAKGIELTLYTSNTSIYSIVHWPSLIYSNSTINLCEGKLSFTFKTWVKDAVVLYQDDNGQSDFLVINLEKGRLHVAARIGNNYEESRTLKVYNDFKEHSVSVRLNCPQACIEVTIDGAALIKKSRISEDCKLSENLQIGGFDRERLDKTNSITYRHFSKYFSNDVRRGFFNACVRNIRYGETRSEGKEITKDTLDRINVEDGCKLNYCHKPDPICKNKGRCSPSREHNVTCDCRWTGFTGKTCTKHALELTLNGTYRVIYNSQSISPEKEQYTFRIKTSQENAVLYYAGGPPHHTDFILIEIRSSKMKLVVNFGGQNQKSGTNYTITSPVKIDDDKWHYVSYTKRREFIWLTVDKVISKKVPLAKKNYRRMDYGGDCFLGEIPEKPYGEIKIQDFIWEIFRGEKVETVNLVTGCYNKCQMRNKYRVEPTDHLPKYNIILPIFTGKPMSNTQGSNSPCRQGLCSSTGSSETTADPNVRSKNVASDSSEGEDDDDASVTWIIVVTIIVSLLLFAAIVFFVRKWNKRYSGDFQVNKKPIGPAGTIVRYQDAAHKEKQRQMKL